MKKAFSLIEVVISVAILSVTILSLIQIKSDNIYLLKKSKDSQLSKDYISIIINLNENTLRNSNLFLDKNFIFRNEEIRKEFKSIKIKVKEQMLTKKVFREDNFNFDVQLYETSYMLNDKIKKNIYTFKIEL